MQKGRCPLRSAGVAPFAHLSLQAHTAPPPGRDPAAVLFAPRARIFAGFRPSCANVPAQALVARALRSPWVHDSSGRPPRQEVRTMRFTAPIALALLATALAGCHDSTAPGDVIPPAAPRGLYSVTGDRAVT